MKSTILNKTPLSGQLEEKSFGNFQNGSIWVEFECKGNTSWYGSFGRGVYGDSSIIELPKICFVIAKGQGYIVSKKDKKLLYESGDDQPIISSIYIKEKQTIYFIDNFSSIFCYQDDEVNMVSTEYNIDGIEFLKQTNGILFGQLFIVSSREYWYEFEMDTRDNKLVIHWDKKVDYWGELKRKKVNSWTNKIKLLISKLIE